MKQLLCALVTISFLQACSPSNSSSSASPPIIVAYASKPMSPAHARMISHVNYSFAKIEAGKIATSHPNDSTNMANLQVIRLANPAIQLLISVGGWGLSGGFSDAALTAESRRIFAASCLDFIKKHQLDGIDLDWEYPGQVGAGNINRPEDKESFTLFLKEIRVQLDQLAKEEKRDTPYLLTIATGANQAYLDHTNMAEAQQYLDLVNIMTYDYTGAWSERAGHHTNLAISGEPNANPHASQVAVAQHLAAGIPPEKLILGVAFYGRSFSGVDSTETGLYQPFSGESGALSYQALAASYIDKNGFTRYWDSLAQAPYLWNDSARIFITYDDPESLTNKAQFAADQGLGGAMFWHYRHDTTGVLLSSLYRQLSQP